MDASLWEVDPGAGLGPLTLGLARAEILERAAQAGLEIPPDDGDPTCLFFDAAEIELYFRPEAPHRLWQIVVADERVRFGGQRVLDRPLAQIMNLLKVPAEETLWRYDDMEDALPEEEPPATGPRDDAELLAAGTLWITTLGLGMVQSLGEISSLWLRQPSDSPRSGLGPWTAAQRQLSADPELPTKIAAARRGPPPRTNYGKWVINLLAVVAAAWLIQQSAQLQQRWNQAIVAQGEVTAVDPPPPEPFPERVTVAYTDQHGVRRQTLLERADFYVVNGIGDKMEIRYLPEAPDKPLGPARVRDIGFDFAIPRVIGLFVAYVVLRGIAAVLFRKLSPRPA